MSNNPLSQDVKLFFPGENLLNDIPNVPNVPKIDLSQAADAEREVIDAACRVIDGDNKHTEITY